MDTLIKDLRYAFRGLLKQPAFTLIVVITLALGIGANTAIFSVVYSVLLKPMPFHQPDRIVLLWGDDRTEGNKRSQSSHTDVVDYRSQQTVFEAVTTFTGWNPLLSGAGEPSRIGAALVGDDFFKVVGTQPTLGRAFLPEEQQDGKDQVVVISDQVWRKQFNSDPNVIGKSLLLNLRPHVVVGVLPAEFSSLPETLINRTALLYRPIAEATDDSQRDARHLRAIGRLKPGVTLSQAQAEMTLIAQRIEAKHPETNTNWGVHLVGLHDDTVSNLRRSLWLILGAVGFVLLIACANIANLLMTRATMRASEMSIRTALGASRWRLLRQSLTESCLLAFIGAGSGLLLAIWGIALVKSVGGEMITQLKSVELSLPALAFTLGLSLVTGLIFGLFPALQSSRSNLIEAIKTDGRTLSSGGRLARLRSALVVSEIAFALVLLMCAGLLIRSVHRLQSVDTGFDYTNALKMDLGLPSLRYSTPEKKVAFYQEVTSRVAQLPGVTSTGVVTPLPSSMGFDSTSIEVEGQPAKPGSEPSADRYIITPGYLKTLGISLRRGRELTGQDIATTQPVMLVSQAFADRFWPNQDPIGKRVQLPSNPGREDKPWRTIVGVVGDVKQSGPDKPVDAALYLPHAQYPASFMTLVARTSGDPAEMIGSVRKAVLSIDPEQVPSDAMTMEQVMATSIQTRRFSMFVLGAFAALALALAAVGIYGVMSYAVAQRTHELGIRMALGAQTMDVLGLVFRSAFGMAFIGIVLGAVGVFGLTRLMAGLLFGVEPTDPPTFAAVCLSLICVSLVACYLPARRATKVDPLIALRKE